MHRIEEPNEWSNRYRGIDYEMVDVRNVPMDHIKNLISVEKKRINVHEKTIEMFQEELGKAILVEK